MALIEGFRVQNYRALRDVTLGKLSNQQSGEALTPFTVVIGKNGVGKSTLFDAFGFVADCLAHDVELACDMKQRGGFDRLRSRGTDEPMHFEIYYREAKGERPMTYELSIALDKTGRPFVESEVLKQRRKGQKHGRPYPFLRLNHGKGIVWAGDPAKREVLDHYAQDSACGTWELLADAVYAGGSAAIRKAGWPLPGQIKHDWAEKITPFMDINKNTSPSFSKFRDGLLRLVD
jgi:predicted ATPase